MRFMATMSDNQETVGDPAGLLRSAFDAAVEEVSASSAVLRHLPAKPAGRCIIVGAGKASAAMAAAIDAAWPDVDVSGIVATRYGHAIPAGRVEIVETGHPVPDESSHRAGQRILDAVSRLGADDLVIAVMSGGASANIVLPIEGLTLAEKQAINRQLLASGAPIEEMNLIRRHLSRIKGGRLGLAAAPAKVVTLAISDIPGDDLAAIGSGPTVPDASTPADAMALIDRFEISIPDCVRARLTGSTPAPIIFSEGHEARLVAAPSHALEAAAAVARRAGVTPVILGDAIEGESRTVAQVIAGIAKSIRRHGRPAAVPAMLISGGETTVTVGSGLAGRGGRNTEFALSLALALAGAERIWGLAADTDGIDGTEDAAGALVSPDTLPRVTSAGYCARRSLDNHDSYSPFAAIGDLVHTGPTLTNVNDVRLVLIA